MCVCTFSSINKKTFFLQTFKNNTSFILLFGKIKSIYDNKFRYKNIKVCIERQVDEKEINSTYKIHTCLLFMTASL